MHQSLFTSESVSEGHPDKVADQISDAILDAILQQDPQARVAAETLVGPNLCVLAGEISTTAVVDYEQVARSVISDIGYHGRGSGFDSDRCEVLVRYVQQSADIARGVDEGVGSRVDMGAGDQGLMFGYACDETPALMPFAIYWSHQLMRRQATLRKSGSLPWLGPDAKTQITCVYDGVSSRPVAIDTVVLSTQHDPDISQEQLREAVIEEIIKPVLPADMLGPNTRFLINPTGRFVVGGPDADCGLTGRKIIVDTYGGSAPHGGGAFSGKDPTKVDRSAAYACRYVAKNIVASGRASRCLIQLSYAIGVAEPVSIAVNTFGTGTVSDHVLVQWVQDHFDLRPKGLIHMLDLQRPIYRQTASYGHFGRDEFSWERTDKVS